MNEIEIENKNYKKPKRRKNTTVKISQNKWEE